jgi:hypothetical protein
MPLELPLFMRRRERTGLRPLHRVHCDHKDPGAIEYSAQHDCHQCQFCGRLFALEPVAHRPRWLNLPALVCLAAVLAVVVASLTELTFEIANRSANRGERPAAQPRDFEFEERRFEQIHPRFAEGAKPDASGPH